MMITLQENPWTPVLSTGGPVDTDLDCWYSFIAPCTSTMLGCFNSAQESMYCTRIRAREACIELICFTTWEQCLYLFHVFHGLT